VGLGGAWVGHDPFDPSEVARAASVLHAALDVGVNWVDTSENYFDTGNEAVIGKALREMPETFLVCSKAAPGAVMSGGGSGFRPEQIRRACERSLQRLGRDHLDLYLLHWPDETGVPLADTWGAMAALVDDGLVRCVGLSNYEREDIARCHAERPVDVVQTGLSLLDYLDDRSLIAWCGEQGIAVTAYEPLAGGILTNRPFEDARARWVGTPWEDSEYFRRFFSSDNAGRTKQVVDAVRTVADDLGATVAQVAIAWVLRQPGVTSAIPGSGNADRFRENARGAEVELSVADIHTLDLLVSTGT
jgi:aryl-alcohol dehydrogenase-like predicted oxidoreductase